MVYILYLLLGALPLTWKVHHGFKGQGVTDMLLIPPQTSRGKTRLRIH